MAQQDPSGSGISANGRNQYPPTNQNGSTERRGFATLFIVLYALALLLIAGFGGMRLYGWARDRIVAGLPNFESVAIDTSVAAAEASTQTTPDPNAAAAPAATEQPRSKAINVLFLGTDERADEVEGPLRTDTIILATLDLDSQTAGMLSLPRDLWVPIPNFNMTTKINTAYGLGVANQYAGGGPQLVMDTVSSFVGQEVPYFVRINFDGFEQMIDLIGGIDIDVPKTIHDEQYPTDDYGVETFHLDAGLQHMDGETSLKYARTRNVDDDYGRSRRQQDVIRAILDKVRSANMLPTLLSNAPSLLSTFANSFSTNIPLDKMIEWATAIVDRPPQEVRQLVLDSRYGEETYSEQGAWILLPDRAKVRAAVNTFFTPPALSSAESVAVASDPTAVNIELLNGAGVPGLAAQVRDLLEARGWHVVSIGDADRGDYAQSILINYGVSEAVIQQVSNALGMQPALASVSGLNPDTQIDMRIVLGQDVLPLLPQQ
jgi:LCP family protein required for cell wall assembly